MNFLEKFHHPEKYWKILLKWGILGCFIGILGGSFVIEKIFAIPGVGMVYINAISLFDYDVFMADTIFYVLIGLLAGIVVDISYGFIDPRIRMGEK